MNGVWYDTEWKFSDPSLTRDWWQWGTFESLEEAKRELRRELANKSTAFNCGRIVSSTPNLGKDGLVHGCRLDVVCEMTAKEAKRKGGAK